MAWQEVSHAAKREMGAQQMPEFVVSSYERAAHQALFGFRGEPAHLVVSVLDPESDLPTDFVKRAMSIGWDQLRHSRVDLYDT